MTQSPYYQPGQAPGYPQQPYAQPGQAPGYPQQPYAQPYPQQGYGQPAPQGPPPVPLATGSIDDFYNQPQAAGGPGISWKDKQIGTWYAGIIAKDATQATQDTDFDTKRPLFQRDGVTPKLVLPIVLKLDPPSPDFPEGDAVFYVRGQARDELQRAMSEAGCSGAPQAGAYFQVQLTQRKANRTGNPSNIVQIVYRPKDGVPHNVTAPAQQAAPAPVEQYTQQAPQAPAQPAPPVQQAPPVAPPMAPPVPQAAPPVAPPAAAQSVQPMAPPQAPQAAPLSPQPPAGLDPNQQAILAQLTQGQAQGQAG